MLSTILSGFAVVAQLAMWGFLVPMIYKYVPRESKLLRGFLGCVLVGLVCIVLSTIVRLL